MISSVALLYTPRWSPKSPSCFRFFSSRNDGRIANLIVASPPRVVAAAVVVVVVIQQVFVSWGRRRGNVEVDT